MARRRAVVAAASSARVALIAAVLLALVAAPTRALADDEGTSLSDARILDAMGAGLRLQSITTRLTGFDQFGHGYQAQTLGQPTYLGPGSERETVFEPQAEVVFSQGERWTHRVWIPVDVVTNASPDAVDVVSSASRHVEGGSIDWTSTYKANHTTDLSMRNGLHLENPFRSWDSGFAIRKSFADEATVVGASAVEVFDWFDRFQIDGSRHGHTDRNGTTGSLAVTQVLTPTTVASVSYGVTVMEGTLGNTWNSVPLATGVRGPELLPTERVRQALVFRAAQWLPWNGALRLYYRLYGDDWGIVAHSLEGQLMQRLTPLLYVGGYYRFHTQTGASFFTTLAPDDGSLRVADSDLARLESHTIGGKMVVDVPLTGRIRAVHFEVDVERYFRTNDLQIDIVSCSTGFRF
jgi:Protein of unknown function (DUF3570)